MVSKEAYDWMLDATFNNGKYERFSPCDSWWNQLGANYATLAKRIAHVEGCQGLERIIMSSWHCNTKIAAVLKLSVKTHKQQGKVGTRPIHATASYKMESMGKYLAMQLRGLMDKDHLLVDIFDLKLKLQSFVVPDSAVLYTIDIKDFFVSGTAKQLADDVHRRLQNDDKGLLIADVLQFLLGAQIVQDPRRDRNAFHKVLHGSGLSPS
eukprot:2086961-Amphidinium_carterae.1